MSPADEVVKATTPRRVATVRTWAEVDLSALRHNVGEGRRLVGQGVDIGAVVKADAYGHGAVAVAQAVVEAGVAALVVANAQEGIELRDAGLDVPIIIAGASLPPDAEAIVACDLAASLSPPEMLDAIAAEARRQRRTARVHLMVDLGMRRDGVTWDEALDLARRLKDTPELKLEGIASHFPTADEADTSFCEHEIAEFRRLTAELEALGLRPPWRHLANSAGILRLPDSHFNLVRAGIMLYGMAGAPLLEGLAAWRPVLAWRTRVCYLRAVPSGTAVGYGHTHVTPRATVLATLPVGYCDGFLRVDSNNADVLVKGRRAPVVGRVSMDYVTADVGHISGVAVGDTVTLLGRDGDECIRAEEIAARRNTIPYEVTCVIGPRVRRVYVPGEATA